MPNPLRFASLVLAMALGMTACSPGAESVEDLMKRALRAYEDQKPDEALQLAGKAIALDPKNPQAYLTRGTIHESLHQPKEAVADYDKVLELDPKQVEVVNRRGGQHFKLGHIEQSIRDFDQYLKARPAQTPKHWQRGISYYYAQRYQDGAKQFEGYQTQDSNDVENAVWRFLCMARSDGVEKARKDILPIGNDRRVPMMQIYALYKGKIEPADVLKAVQEGNPNEKDLHYRLFYAHLYLGLYYEALTDPKKAFEHLSKAANDYKIGDYMWDVAHVHVERLRKGTSP